MKKGRRGIGKREGAREEGKKGKRSSSLPGSRRGAAPAHYVSERALRWRRAVVCLAPGGCSSLELGRPSAGPWNARATFPSSEKSSGDNLVFILVKQLEENKRQREERGR